MFFFMEFEGGYSIFHNSFRWKTRTFSIHQKIQRCSEGFSPMQSMLVYIQIFFDLLRENLCPLFVLLSSLNWTLAARTTQELEKALLKFWFMA